MQSWLSQLYTENFAPFTWGSMTLSADVCICEVSLFTWFIIKPLGASESHEWRLMQRKLPIL